MASTTNYSWTTPDNTSYVKDGASSIRTLGSSVDTTLFTALGGAYPGLRLIKKQTIGSAVSSVSVTSAFSATYDNYKIIISSGVGSTGANLSLNLTGSSASYSMALINSAYNNNAPANGGQDNVSAWNFIGAVRTDFISLDVNLTNPFLAKQTLFSSNYVNDSGGGYGYGIHKVATSYTGFTITPASGTLTGGTIYVYGYGAS